MNKIKIGDKVIPLKGFDKGIEGIVINIYEGEDYPIQVQFGEGDTNSYYDYQLELIQNEHAEGGLTMNNGTVRDINILNKNYMNTLLDAYNDYILLHDMFGDEEYRYIAEDIMNEIRYVNIV